MSIRLKDGGGRDENVEMDEWTYKKGWMSGHTRKNKLWNNCI